MDLLMAIWLHKRCPATVCRRKILKPQRSCF
jgi:hypothetical protein